MNTAQLTCDRVDRDDLDTRYLAGTLPEDLAEAFEAHYFACERCWQLVHAGAEVRAAGRPATDQPAASHALTRWSRRAWIPIAAAAAILVMWTGRRSPSRGDVGDTVRGAADNLVVAAESRRGVLQATWQPVDSASRYHVRLFTATGEVVLDRSVTDTSVAVARVDLGAASAGALYWQVQALSVAGAALARSTLVEVPPDALPR